MNKEKPDNTSQRACHYLTFNTVDWVDIFVRAAYKEIIADSLNYFIEKCGLTVFSWCLMSNHLHMLVQAKDGSGLAQVEKEFKKQTAQRILEAMDQEVDLRRDWMLQRFEQFSHNLKKIERFQLWQSCSNPVFIDFKQVFKLQERLLYIHENPVRDKITASPQDYVFSSAGDYAGVRTGPVQVKVIDFEALRKSIVRPDSPAS
ncbi:MAG: transposase [Chitinophagaceae bacterium]